MPYVIKDKDTDLYIKIAPCRLVKLNDATLFSTEEEAKCRIPSIVNNLVWKALEDKYQMDRWHIDVNVFELNDLTSQFSSLKVVEVDINEKT